MTPFAFSLLFQSETNSYNDEYFTIHLKTKLCEVSNPLTPPSVVTKTLTLIGLNSLVRELNLHGAFYFAHYGGGGGKELHQWGSKH